jgi:hypothetical protein
MSQPSPGFDQIALTAPEAGQLCYSATCRRARQRAVAVVTFGELGTRFCDDLWAESWHRPCLMCGQCWQRTQYVAVKHRPCLMVLDRTGSDVPLGPYRSLL